MRERVKEMTKTEKKNLAVFITRSEIAYGKGKSGLSTKVRFASAPDKKDDAELRKVFGFFHDKEGYYYGSFRVSVEDAKAKVEELGYRPTFDKVKEAAEAEAEKKAEPKSKGKGKKLDADTEAVVKAIAEKLKDKNLEELKKISALIDLI